MAATRTNDRIAERNRAALFEEVMPWWLRHARHGFAPAGEMDFRVSRDGHPRASCLRLYTECFAAMTHAELGEFYGYPNRDGSPIFTAKANGWKGCFHLPRSFFRILRTATRENADNVEIP